MEPAIDPLTSFVHDCFEGNMLVAVADKSDTFGDRVIRDGLRQLPKQIREGDLFSEVELGIECHDIPVGFEVRGSRADLCFWGSEDLVIPERSELKLIYASDDYDLPVFAATPMCGASDFLSFTVERTSMISTWYVVTIKTGKLNCKHPKEGTIFIKDGKDGSRHFKVPFQVVPEQFLH